MVRSSCGASLVVSLIAQALLPQDAIELIDAQAANIVNKILCYTYFLGIHRLEKELLDHISYGLLTQFRWGTKPPGMALTLWSAAVQHHLPELACGCTLPSHP